MKETKNYDVLILGGGPAGLSAATYAARSGASVVVIDKSTLGGQPQYYLDIENYPGYSGSSFELSNQFVQQAEKFGACFYELQEIISVKLRGTIKEVETSEFSFRAKAIIIATGAYPRLLNVPGEKEYFGKGVSYCAICDGPFYKGKEVAVIGGGNAAIEEACYLTNFASKVYVIHRRERLRADKVIRDRAFNNPKIEFWWQSQVCEIIGDGHHVSSLYLMKEGEPAMLEVNGVFPYIGYLPNTDGLNSGIYVNEEGILADWELHVDESEFIVTDECMRTSIDGVFAAGDVRVKPLRQVVTAVADGAMAGTYACKHVELLRDVRL